MIQLDYRTDNPRWGLSGIRFTSWESYSFTLGYLSNLAHYDNKYHGAPNAKVSVHIEGNDEQGAWDKEGRIHYYGTLKSLKATFDDLYACRSAGIGRIIKRINSNGYILSLINDYGFKVQTYTGRTTADIFPTDVTLIVDNLKRYLMNMRLPNSQIDDCLNNFWAGYKL